MCVYICVCLIASFRIDCTLILACVHTCVAGPLTELGFMITQSTLQDVTKASQLQPISEI